MLLAFREHELSLSGLCELLKHVNGCREGYHRALYVKLLHSLKGVKDVARVTICNARKDH